MVSQFYSLFMEEMGYTKVERWAKESLRPLVEDLDKAGVLALYLKLASSGGSIWRSALPRKQKRQLKEKIATNRPLIEMLAKDPERLIEIAMGALPPPLSQKILRAAPQKYWLGQLQEAYRDSLPEKV